MKKIFKAILITLFSAVSVLLVTEGILRFCYFVAVSPEDMARIKFYNALQIRLYSLWMTPDQADPFLPPFLVYSNRNFDDEARLTKIFNATKLPPSQTWESYDFLQHESRNSVTRYEVSSNSFGFRSHEFAKEKPPKTKRVIALGSYHTFGLGLNDEETYPSQLERELNLSAKDDVKYEVWNGGRAAGTAIVGLARLKNEIFDFNPDMIILDYGFIDLDVWGDNIFPIVMRLPDNSLVNFIKGSILKPLVPIIGNTLLWNKIHSRFFIGKIDIDPTSKDGDRLEQFRRTMDEIVRLTTERNIPIVVMRNLLARPPRTIYSTLAEKYHGAIYVNVSDLFHAYPPSIAQWTASNWKSTWLSEFSDPKSWAHSYDFRFYPYRLNYFQLNQSGQLAIARGLRDVIHKYETEKSSSRKK